MSDEAYFRMRAEQHRKLAAATPHPAARAIHLDLAILYDARAKVSGGGFVPED